MTATTSSSSLVFVACVSIAVHCHTTAALADGAWHARFGNGSLSNSALHAGLELFSSDGRSAAWQAVPTANALPWQIAQVANDPDGYPETVSVSGPGNAVTQLACCSTAGLPVLFSLDTRQGDSMGALLWHTQVNLSAFNNPTFDYYDSMPMDLLLAVEPAAEGEDKQQGETVVVSAFGGYGQVPLFACIAAHSVVSNTSNTTSGGAGGNTTVSLLWSACYDMPWSLDGYPIVRLVQLSDSMVGFFYSNTTALFFNAYLLRPNGTLVASQVLPLLDPAADWSSTANYAAFAVSVPQILSDVQAWSKGVSFAVSFTGTPEVSLWHLNVVTGVVQRVWAADPTAHHPRCNISACWHPSPVGAFWMLGANAGLNTPMWSGTYGILIHYCTHAAADTVQHRPGCVTGLSASTGAVLWQQPAPAVVPVTLSLHNDTAIVVTSGVGWFGFPPAGPSLMMGLDITTGRVKYRVGPGDDAIFGWSTMDGRGRVYVEAQFLRMCAVLAYSSFNGQVLSSTDNVMVNSADTPQLMGAPFHVGPDGGLYSAHSRYGPLIAMYPLPSPGPTVSPRPYPSYSPTPSTTPTAAPAQAVVGQGGII